jgi:hypothetical protein
VTEKRENIMNLFAAANCLFGMQRMRSETKEVQVLIEIIASALETAADFDQILSWDELVLLLYGSQGLDSSHEVVKRLIVAVRRHVERMPALSALGKSPALLEPRELSMLLHGLQRMSSHDEEVLDLLQALHVKIAKFPARFSIDDIFPIFALFCRLESENEVVRHFSLFIAKKVTGAVCHQSDSSFDFKTLCLCLEPLGGLSSRETEVCALLTALREKSTLNKAPATPADDALASEHITACLAGLRRKSPDDCDAVKSILEDLLAHLKAQTAGKLLAYN